MEICDQLSLEIAKYSFLLGSALRHEDEEQFFNVYDSIIPSYLDCAQVEWIKEEARRIAELSEEEYNQLVTNARSFSLARPFVAMTDPKDALKSIGTKPNFAALQRTSRHVRDSNPAEFTIQIEDVNDTDPHRDSASDSGIFNASKTTSHGSITCNDDTDDMDLADQEDQERVGVYDYYPEAESQKKRATERDPTGNFAFTSFKSKAAELDKPRIIDIGTVEITSDSPSSDNFRCKEKADGHETFDEDSATEMQDLSTKKQQMMNDMLYDEAIPVDSDDEGGGTSDLHEKLYGVFSGKTKRYTSMINEEIEDYESSESRCNKPLLSSQNRRYDQGTITKHSQVDHGKITMHDPRGYGAVDSVVDFKLKTDSDGSLMPSASYSRPSLEEGGGRYIGTYDPPFGTRVSIQKVGETVGRTLPNTSGRGHNISSMPPGSPISISDQLAGRDNNKFSDIESGLKRKKRKKKAKEDSPDDHASCKEASYDLNGNPITGPAIYPKLPQRSTPKMGNRMGGPFTKETYGTGAMEKRSAFPNSLEDMNFNNGITCDLDNYKQKQQRKNKKKEKKESKLVKAAHIPGNRGEEDVEKLLDFIENNPSKKKKKGVLQNGIVSSVSSVTESASLDTKTENKKSKEKKTKNNSLGKDDKTISENSSERGDDVSSKASDIFVEASENLQDSTNDLSLKDNDISSEISNSSTSACSVSKKEDTLNILTDRYIFTDFSEIPQKEEEFKPVVNNRKKKRHPKEPVPVKETPNETKRTARRKYPQGARSVTPPPIPSSRVERPTDRAFSPSAFPVLGREGRRNSTGNAPLDASNQDDSDIESVRSLPLSSSMEKSINEGLKPIISYAKVAAGPTLQGSSSVTVITGNNSNDFPVTSPNGQNSEFDNEANSSSHGELHSPTPVLQSPLSETSLISRDGTLDNSLWDAALGATAQSTPQKDIGGDSNIFDISMTSFDTEYPLLGSGLANQVMESDKSIKDKSNGDKNCDDSVKEPLGSNSSSNNSDKLAVIETGSIQASNKITCTYNSKKPKGKSVVFLDGKFNDTPPKDLGISFGFDNSLEYSGPSDSSPQTENHSDSGVNSPSNEAELSGNYSPDSAGNKNVLDKTKAIEKLQTLANRNGVAVGKTLAAQGTKDMKEAVSTSAVHNYKVSGNCDIKNGHGDVYKSKESSVDRDQVGGGYSQVDVPKQDNKVSTETQTVTVSAPKIDYNMDRSRFNYEDAVMFVKKEWDRVMSTRKRDSRKVLMYDSNQD